MASHIRLAARVTVALAGLLAVLWLNAQGSIGGQAALAVVIGVLVAFGVYENRVDVREQNCRLEEIRLRHGKGKQE